MFRRKREASLRPPASAAWWPVSASGDADPAGYEGYGGYHGYGEQPPALPDGDPFGGWPAFPPADPVDPVLGRPEPFDGWNPPGPAGHPSHPAAHPAFPGSYPPPPVPGHRGDHVPSDPTAPAPARPAGPAAGRPAAPPAGPSRSWTPLLTHADDGQPFRTDQDDTDDPDLAGDADLSGADPSGAGPIGADAVRPAGHPETRRVRAARRRAARAAEDRTPPATTAPATPAATSPAASAPAQAPAAPVTRFAPAADPPRDSAFSRGATTWLDPVAPPDPMEAASLAGAFAADYLSWDEAAQRRRGAVLAQYLPSDVVGSADLLGWSGKGRQRAEFSLPGAVRQDGDGRVVVDVRVRVTPYVKVGVPAEPAPAEELEVAGVPAVAPAPTARGWKSMDSYWVRLTVPVIYDRGRLVVDVWEEQLGGEEGVDGVDADLTDDVAHGDRPGDTARPDGGTDGEAPRPTVGPRDAQGDPLADQVAGGPR
jgi:hypothetical protein